MKTFEQFLNESMGKPTGNITGCEAIEKMYDFLRTNASSDKLFKADRVEEINDEQFLIYALDKNKFERLSGISLSNITEGDVANEECYSHIDGDDDGDRICDWVDKPNNTKWGVLRRYINNFGKEYAYIMIFVIDRETKCVSTIEYARIASEDSESKLGTYCNTNVDFLDIWDAYDSSRAA